MVEDAALSLDPGRAAPDFLAGGGEMGARIRAFDWAATPLGSPADWPRSLKTAVRIMLTSRQPFWIGWGKGLIYLYNDPYKSIIGGKHPWALGQPTAAVWREIWDHIEPLLATALRGEEGTYSEAQLLIMERNGYPEETYYTFSYSPIPDDDGSAGGIICANTDDTQRVIGERQLALLRELAARTADARTVLEVCERSAQAFGTDAHDLPFAMIYLAEPGAARVSLAAVCGIERGHQAAPEFAAVDSPTGWPFADVLREHEVRIVSDLETILGGTIPTGAWQRAPQQAAAFPIAASGETGRAGILIVGLNPFRLFDDSYRGFLGLAAGQIAAAIANAEAYEAERRRAEALAELDRAKTAFFSNVSHEFRTPLTLMLGPLDELKREFGRAASGLTVPQYQQIDLVHRSGLRLLKLVNTLLDFSRIEAGRLQAVYEQTDLSSHTAEVASVFRAAIEKAGLKLVVNCPPHPEPAFVDREMWEKIVLNLVSNAFKFTFDGEIEVRLGMAGGHFELAVRDTGIGVPADEVPRLFERFHRVAGAQGRTHEGSGIGLALVQELSRLHGGSVSVESVYGRGSTFRVFIPRGKDHLPAEEIGTARTQASTALGALPFVEEALRWLPDAGAVPGGLPEIPVEAPATAPETERPRVLLADDNADMREYVRRLLSPRFEVEAVADGEAALAAIRERAPDLVLSDVMMPRLDGVELVARLRADPGTSTLPIILLSARAGEEAKEQGLAAGADDYLVKPFSARELLAHVAANIKAAEIRRESTAALRESEERFRHMADNAPVMIWVTDPDARCSYLSKSWYDFTGHTAETALGFGWTDAVHPDDRAAARDTFLAANARREPFRMECRLRRKDGEYRWAIDAAAPRFGAAGEFLGYIGSVIDITERKQAEEMQQLLVSELNHRVKNTLASVQAIVQHTLRRTRDPEEFVTSFAGRIQSLSRVHSILTSTTWQGADLRELIRDQLLSGSVDETRLTAAGPAVRLESQMALHVALMLHELGTNANKHGALSRPQGRVTINWTVDDGSLHLRWVERGGPAVSAPTSHGFGMALIEQSAKGEGGDARLSLHAEGLIWEIALPLPHSGRSGGARSERPAAVPPGAALAREVTRTEEKTPAQLAGARFLVVEDEPLVALDIIAGLQDAGAEVPGQAGTVKEALQLIEHGSFDAALLDGNLRGQPVDEIAAALTRRRVPFLFVTGYGSESLPRAFAKVTALGKPFTPRQLVEAATRLVGQPADVIRLRD